MEKTITKNKNFKLLNLYAVLFFLLLIGNSCENWNQSSRLPKIEPGEVISETQKDSLIEQLESSIKWPTQIEGTEYLLFPVHLENDYSTSKYGRFSFYGGSGEYYSNQAYNYIFYHKTTQAYRYLLEDLIGYFDRIYIYSESEAEEEQTQKRYKKGYIFYELSERYWLPQTTQGKEPESMNYERLYFSKDDGTEFKLISPPAAEVISWGFLEGSEESIILMKIRRDINEDYFYDYEDEEAFIQLALDSLPDHAPLFPPTVKKEIGNQFFEYLLPQE